MYCSLVVLDIEDINFFDQLQQSRTGGINTTYQLASEFIMNDIPVGNYYFQWVFYLRSF